MRKVLVIAYDFPPRGGSGVQRTVKFAKYLPALGWQPVILTVSNLPSREADRMLLDDLPGDLPVYRAPDLDMRFLRGIAHRRPVQPDGSRSQKTGAGSAKAASPLRSEKRKAWTHFVETWFLIPDSCIRWLPAALWTGLKVVRQCDAIYSTSAPFTDHLVAALLHRVSGKPWIADFRDPWTQYAIYQHSGLRSHIDASLEECLLKAANVVTVTCAAAAKSFRQAHPSLPADKFIEITNGFDAEDFDQAAGSLFDTFTIAYTGRFDEQKNASYFFLQALKELRGEYPELAPEIKTLFAGSFDKQGRALLARWSLEGMVKLLGYLPHHESVQLLLKSHVLLLTLNDEPGVNLTYPGKLFEYLAARKTVLALVPEGATASLLRGIGAGPVVAPDDVEAIKKAILDLHNQYRQGTGSSRTYDNLQRFERRALTERLAQCLDAVVQGRPLCV